MANVFKLALRRLRQQDEFKACLGYTASKKLFLTGSKHVKFVQCAKPTRQESKLRILGCEATLSHQQEATPWLAYLFLAISTLPLHGLHQVHQPVHEGLLCRQQGAHDSDRLVALSGQNKENQLYLHRGTIPFLY